MIMPPALHAKPLLARTIVNPISGNEVIFLETCRETDGHHTALQIRLAARSSSSPRCHENSSQELRCLEGELQVHIGNKVTRLLAGETATVPARRKHRFVNHTPVPCHFQCWIMPGFPGFEQFLQITYGLARAGKTTRRGIPRNLFELSYLLMISGTCLPGWLAALQPMLPWLGKRAIHNGMAAELQRRYFTIW